MTLKKISVKHLIWLASFVALLLGWHYHQSSSWIALVILLVIDIPSTIFINRSITKGEQLGDPVKDLKKITKESAKDFVIGKALSSVLPEEIAEGYLAAKSSQEEIKENYRFSLAFRTTINVIWTIALLTLTIYGFAKWL